jgi:hypothetical protein
MNLVGPAVFPRAALEILDRGFLASFPDFFSLLETIRVQHPSLLLGFSAHPGMGAEGKKLAERLALAGFNIFYSKVPVPMSALSLALITRHLPLGLYFSETGDGDVSLTPISIHGGPFSREDIQPDRPTMPRINGVIGETDLIRPYVQQLSGLLDPFLPEEGIRFTRIDSPFRQIDELIRRNPAYSLCSQDRKSGPWASISVDGQGLEVIASDGNRVPDTEILATICRYLIEERLSLGTIIGPPGTARLFTQGVETIEVEGPNSLVMSHRAVFSDLLLGWWEPGIIAHQGHSPFGDAYLSLAYLLEAWNSPT